VRCVSEAERSFGSGHCLIEKYIARGKHVEIQILGDGEKVISLLDRECSIQRRYQKLIEESPCPWLSPAMRERMSNSAIEIAKLLKYVSAGTVEFIVVS
jgi:acetyl/propionyl-CoA carboxylase alpha subunit